MKETMVSKTVRLFTGSSYLATESRVLVRDLCNMRSNRSQSHKFLAAVHIIAPAKHASSPFLTLDNTKL